MVSLVLVVVVFQKIFMIDFAEMFGLNPSVLKGAWEKNLEVKRNKIGKISREEQ